jgi:hypothetical protein
MPSQALAALLAGLSEIDALQRANPTPLEGSGLKRPDVVRALGRSEVVLLSSHFERYVYALTEEAVQYMLLAAPKATAVPLSLRLQHSKGPIDELAATQWDNRSEKLRDFALTDAVLWRDDVDLQHLDHERLLIWMKAPHSKNLVKAFRMWGVDDIFTAITRTKTTRQALYWRVGELVQKRNSIAHGDLTVEATYLDIRRYRRAVKVFCERVDGQMARAVAKICSEPSRPW